MGSPSRLKIANDPVLRVIYSDSDRIALASGARAVLGQCAQSLAFVIEYLHLMAAAASVADAQLAIVDRKTPARVAASGQFFAVQAQDENAIITSDKQPLALAIDRYADWVRNGELFSQRHVDASLVVAVPAADNDAMIGDERAVFAVKCDGTRTLPRQPLARIAQILAFGVENLHLSATDSPNAIATAADAHHQLFELSSRVAF